MWPIMFGHILFLTARPALCHLSLYFCFTSTDARKRATFSAFQKSRELGDDVVVVCGMAPIILIYLPRHLEMVTCQKNIIHNISERSHKHASNKKIWPCFIESRKCFSCKRKLCKIKGESFANLPEVNKVNILKKESLETKSKWCKTLYISCICILRDYP